MTLWSIWPSFPAPASQSGDGVSAVRWARGNRFRTTCPGLITAIVFHTPTTSGTLIVHLWDNAGTALATKTFQSGGTSAGWYTVPLDTPVQVNPCVTYMAGVYNSLGAVSFSSGGLSATGANGPLIALADKQFGDINGAYTTAGDVFPTADTTLAYNFWVDVVFDDSTPVPVVVAPPWTSGPRAIPKPFIRGQQTIVALVMPTANANSQLRKVQIPGAFASPMSFQTPKTIPRGEETREPLTVQVADPSTVLNLPPPGFMAPSAFPGLRKMPPAATIPSTGRITAVWDGAGWVTAVAQVWDGAGWQAAQVAVT